MKIYSILAAILLLSACAYQPQPTNSRDGLLQLIAKKGQTRTYAAGLTAEQFILKTDPVFADQKNKTLLTALVNSNMGTFVGAACPAMVSAQELAALRNNNKGAFNFMQKFLMTMNTGMSAADANKHVGLVGVASLQEFQDRNYLNCPPEANTAFKYGQDGAKFILDFAYVMTGQKWSANQ